MKEIDIFSEKYSDFFSYDDETIDYLNKIGNTLNYTEEDLKYPKARKEVLDVIRELLKLGIIEVKHWGEDHDLIQKLKLNTDQTLVFLEEVWPKNLEYPDYFGFITLGYKKWYMKKMDELGYVQFNTDWKSFVKEKIGDLKQWIEKNRPKE